MKKHNARRKKVESRKKTSQQGKGPSGFGVPNNGFISDSEGHKNYEMMTKFLASTKKTIVDNGEFPFAIDEERGAVDFRLINQEDKDNLISALLHSRILAINEPGKTTGMNPYFEMWNGDPHWNIGSMGSIWMDVQTSEGTEYRISVIANYKGDRAFFFIPWNDNVLSNFILKQMKAQGL